MQVNQPVSQAQRITIGQASAENSMAAPYLKVCPVLLLLGQFFLQSGLLSLDLCQLSVDILELLLRRLNAGLKVRFYVWPLEVLIREYYVLDVYECINSTAKLNREELAQVESPTTVVHSVR